MTHPDQLEKRLAEFVPERLSVDWRSGPPYPMPPEVDVERSMQMAQLGQRVRINRRVLTDEQLRDPRTRVMFAFAPESDFDRDRVVDGVTYPDRMGDVMGSMTGTANPPELTLRSVSPNYAAEWLRANLPEGRVAFTLPATEAAFEADFLQLRPDVLLLSGLNVNTRVLLRMALFARRHGVKEVWLGCDVAIAPYRILDEFFDRAIWGPGEAHLREVLVGDQGWAFRHPGVDRMLADVHWLVLDGDRPKPVDFKTLHLALRLGCTQSCAYCAEGIKSMRGKAVPATPFEAFRELVDEARSKGIKRVYFVDPDFGRLWKEDLEGKAVDYLAKQGMRFSILSNIRTLDRYGERLADSGLASIYLGIESLASTHAETGNKLRAINRLWQDTRETVRQAMRMTDMNVMTMGLYILGNPGETTEAMWNGVEKLKQIVPLSQISTNQPFPGTAEFQEASQKGWVHDYDPDSIRYGCMVWAPSGHVIDPAEMARAYVRAHKQVNDLWRPGGFFDRQKAVARKRAQQPAARRARAQEAG